MRKQASTSVVRVVPRSTGTYTRTSIVLCSTRTSSYNINIFVWTYFREGQTYDRSGQLDLYHYSTVSHRGLDVQSGDMNDSDIDGILLKFYVSFSFSRAGALSSSISLPRLTDLIRLSYFWFEKNRGRPDVRIFQ